MIQKDNKISWVDFSAIKQNVSFLTILDHYCLFDTLQRKGDKLVGPCPIHRGDSKCFDDGQRLMCDVGRYQPNAWSLHDMHGNACEWTRSEYVQGRPEKKVVRGGSWGDRPKHARSGWRWGYRPYQAVYNVGFRVVIHPANRRKL